MMDTLLLLMVAVNAVALAAIIYVFFLFRSL